jgi:Carboxypeptidase regulatory-like domain
MAKDAGELVVRVYAYESPEARGPESDRTRRLAGCTVTVRDAANAIVGEQDTDENGQAVFHLPPADYTVAVHTPDVYEDPAEQWFEGKQYGARALPVKQGMTTTVSAGCPPRRGKVVGTVRHADDRPADGVVIEAYRYGKLLAAATTGADGDYTIWIHPHGQVDVRPRRPITWDGRRFDAEPPSQILYLPAGATRTADFTLQPAAGVILVDAVIANVDDEAERRRLREGLEFHLYRGSEAVGVPLRRITNWARTTIQFDDLGPDLYTVVAVVPGTGLRRVKPDSDRVHVRLHEGETLKLDDVFTFEPSTGSVAGEVLAEEDRRPLEGVKLVLVSQDQPSAEVPFQTTDERGKFQFDGLAPGWYVLMLERDPVTVNGVRWASTDGHARRVRVRPFATRRETFLLAREEHRITGLVRTADGTPIPSAVIQVRTDPSLDAEVIATVTADDDGSYAWEAETAGTYYLMVAAPSGTPAQRAEVTVNSVTRRDLVLGSGSAPFGRGGGGGFRSDGPIDFTPFPVLTEEVDLGRTGGGAPPAGTGAGGAGQTVERALRDVLGWRPKASDPRGFLAALEQAFVCEEVEGHTECRLSPRSYALEVRADLGAVTGAQASIYQRGRTTLDQVLPLLAAIEPLRTDADEEDTEAIRAIIESELTELVNELAVEGGPRVQRVDELFSQLLGPPTRSPDPEQVGGQFRQLLDRFGLSRNRVNTINEEKILSDALLAVDYVNGLAQAWDLVKAAFDRGNTTVEPFLGTQLLLLSRALAVVSESVHEVEFTLDSVFLGPAERQTLELTFPASGSVPASPPLFLADLLSWVERAASEEGPRLIQDGGKDGVVAFTPTLALLESLVERSLAPPQTGVPDAYRLQRVQRALRELADQLEAARELAERIQRFELGTAITQRQPTSLGADVLTRVQEVLADAGLLDEPTREQPAFRNGRRSENPVLG